MSDIQKLKCPECGEEFEFDPNANENVITSLNESHRPKLNKEIVVTAYLKCPNGHIKPYKVKKTY
jgi:Fe2+ or Zn2+ uptake regulation protein